MPSPGFVVAPFLWAARYLVLQMAGQILHKRRAAMNVANGCCGAALMIILLTPIHTMVCGFERTHLRGGNELFLLEYIFSYRTCMCILSGIIR